MNIRKILAASITVLLFASCAKEHNPGRIELLLEPLGNTKLVATTDSTAVWSDNDIIRINGTTATITRESDGRAYIPPTASATNRALFPASLATSGPSSDNVTVTLPAVYQYALENNKQKISFPLAATATDDNPLRFYHLTGALCFTIKNSLSTPLTVDHITVTSNSYRLNGNFNVNFNDLSTIAPQTTDVQEERKVTLYFDHQELTIPAGESAKVLMPIAPVGSRNHFTVNVSTHYQGKRYPFSNTQTTGGALTRNQLGYATVEFNNPNDYYNLFSGRGTENNPFLINSVSEFLLMAQAINSHWTTDNSTDYSKCNYRLTSDLDLTGITISPINLSDGYIFKALEPHILKGLTIESVVESKIGYCALFKNSAAGAFSNIILKDITLKHQDNVSYLYIGGFLGKTNNVAFENCRVDGLTINVSGTISEVAYFGAFVAETYGNNSFTNCTSNLSPSISLTASTLNFGCLAGRCYSSGESNPKLTIENCRDTLTSNITVYGGLNYGSLVGTLATATTTITGCSYYGNDTLNTSGNLNVGGLIGTYARGNGSLSISSSIVAGTIHASTSSGTIHTNPYVGTITNGSMNDPNSCTNNLSFE